MKLFADTNGVWRYFPVPEFLLPRAAGIDISDSSIKWIVLGRDEHGLNVENFGEAPLKSGVVEHGAIVDAHALALQLSDLKHELGDITCAHVALPEEPAYVFNMRVPGGTSRDQVLRMIEFEFDGRVPIQPSAAVYDYDVITAGEGEDGTEIGVSVFPREVAESYAATFQEAGITLLSLEIEARSIARAVAGDSAKEPITLLVDFGRARTGFALLNRAIPIFTSTVEVGGDIVTKAVIDTLGLSDKDAEIFKNEEGLIPKEGVRSPKTEAVAAPASALADEIVRHYRYWDTRRDEHGERVTPVSRIILVGGSANLKGLPEYVAARVQAKVERGNVWRYLAPFRYEIPPIDERTSLEYATAVGLALRSHESRI